MLKDTLQKIGLTDKEAQIYLASLHLGPSAVSAIAETARQNRVSAYDILEKLARKGFVSFYTRRGVKYFSPTDPEIIVKETKRKTEELEKSLPELRRIHGKTNHPRVQYFEGIEGIKAIYADTLTSKTEILNYANSQEVRRSWPDYDTAYVQKRVHKKIRLRGIAPLDKYGLKVKQEDKKYFREIRLIPTKEFNFSNEINIYDDKVAIVSFKDELIGMIIESSEIANTQRAIFKMAWEFSGKFHTTKKSPLKNITS